MVHLSEILSPVTPAESRGRLQSQMIEFEFSGVNWEMVPESKLVSEGEATIAWGGYPGSYDTVETDGFEAVVGYFDSALSETNVVYITDSNAYVYEFVLEQVSKEEIRAEVFRVLTDLSRSGIVEGLKPVEEVMPPDYREFLEFHDDIEEFEIEERNGDIICRVNLDEPTQMSDLATELRTVNEVRYPKPDRFEVIDERKNHEI